MVDLVRGRRRRGPSKPVRWVARALAVGRIGLGVAMVASPATATRRWLGEVAEDDPGREVAVRGLGARDVVLGIGTLVAFRSGGEVRHAARWIEAGIVADLADTASTAVAEDLSAPRNLPIAVALGAAVTGVLVRSRLR